MSASQQTVGGEVSLTRNERLDRLPFNKAHRKLLVASGIGWAFDAMDVGLVSFVVAAIAADPHFNLTPTEKSWVLSIGFVGMAIGAALGGFVPDFYCARDVRQNAVASKQRRAEVCESPNVAVFGRSLPPHYRQFVVGGEFPATAVGVVFAYFIHGFCVAFFCVFHFFLEVKFFRAR